MQCSLQKLILLILGINLFVAFILFAGIDIESPTFLIRQEIVPQTWDNVPPIPLEATSQWEEYLDLVDLEHDHQQIINEDDYCARVVEWQAAHPIRLGANSLPIKVDRVTFSDYLNGNLVKDVLKSSGILVLKEYNIEIEEYDWQDLPALTTLPVSIRLFVHKSPSWHLYHLIGEHFLCEGQFYNHIPGNDHLTSKDEIVDQVREYGAYYEGREECFNPWKFLPYTLNMKNRAHCLELVEHLKADKQSINWIRKISRNSHNAEGVDIVSEEVADEILRAVKDGELCGQAHEKYIVQQYIADPLLVYKRKFDFRVYMVILSMDPFIVLYHDGFLRVSLYSYDSDSSDTMAHVTNTQLAKNMLEAKNATAAEWEETMQSQMWTFPTFERYMVEEGLVKPGWLEDFLRPVMKEKMLHLSRMHFPTFLPHPRVFEIFGIDFLFDSSLNLWFLEANRSPAMQATTKEKGEIQSKMIQEMTDLVLALHYGDFDEVLETSNYELVIDGRQRGVQRYLGQLSSECL
jgi:hypothetical protein